jgi:glycosyltransferase involved in cell wall biosynthesis
LDVFNSFTEQKYSGQVLRNLASLIPHRLTPSGSTIRKRLSLEGKVIFFYGGNIGHAQDMSNLMRLVKSMRNYSNAHFLFVGQGDEVDLINRLAVDWNLENFSYLPSVNQDEFKEILTDIDVGLFSLSPAHTAHNFPGKLLGYMVQSKPILGSVNDGNYLMELINSAQAGCISINGNDELLVENAIKILKDEAYSKSLGMNGYQLLSDEFSVESISNTILQELQGANK